MPVETAVIHRIPLPTLNINSDWLMNGEGEMKKQGDRARSDRVLRELWEVASRLSEDGQFYLLDIAKGLL